MGLINPRLECAAPSTGFREGSQMANKVYTMICGGPMAKSEVFSIGQNLRQVGLKPAPSASGQDGILHYTTFAVLPDIHDILATTYQH